MTQNTKPAITEGGQIRHPKLWGEHSPAAVCRWMGRAGFTSFEAFKALQSLNCKVSESMIATQVPGWQSRGEVPTLSDEHAAYLLRFRSVPGEPRTRRRGPKPSGTQPTTLHCFACDTDCDVDSQHATVCECPHCRSRHTLAPIERFGNDDPARTQATCAVIIAFARVWRDRRRSWLAAYRSTQETEPTQANIADALCSLLIAHGTPSEQAAASSLSAMAFAEAAMGVASSLGYED